MTTRLVWGGRVLAAATAAAMLAVGLAVTPASGQVRTGMPPPAAGGACDAFSGAHQLAGSDGVVPAAYSDAALVVPVCGPLPGSGGDGTPVYPYPDALSIPGYQCVEFAERYLYYRFGVTMDIATNGDQIAGQYAAQYGALFMVIRNGTAHDAPVKGDVLSMSTSPDFDSASGGRAAVVQASHVDSSGDGTLTIVGEDVVGSGVQVIGVHDWTVMYPGFPYVEWLTTTGLTVTTPTLPPAGVSRAYQALVTATGGKAPYRWSVTSGSLPGGLTLSPAGTISGAATASGTWTFGVTVRDASGATAVADLQLTVTGSP